MWCCILSLDEMVRGFLVLGWLAGLGWFLNLFQKSLMEFEEKLCHMGRGAFFYYLLCGELVSGLKPDGMSTGWCKWCCGEKSTDQCHIALQMIFYLIESPSVYCGLSAGVQVVEI